MVGGSSGEAGTRMVEEMDSDGANDHHNGCGCTCFDSDHSCNAMVVRLLTARLGYRFFVCFMHVYSHFRLSASRHFEWVCAKLLSMNY
jgi:hypothetical protein